MPTYHDEKLGTSSLILADKMNTVSSRDIGNGNFVIGNTFIRPRVATNPATPVSFNRQPGPELLDAGVQPGHRRATKSNSATVTYQITDSATGTVILEKAAGFKGLRGAQRSVDGGENPAYGRTCRQESTRSR